MKKNNLGGKQDRHYVERKPNQPRKRFKGPMPQSEVVIECEKVLADNRPSMDGDQGASLSPEEENHAISQAQAPCFEYEPESSDIPDPSANSCLAESTILPHLDEQGNQFPFLDFLYDTNALQLQNSYATETTSPAYPKNAATMHPKKKMDSRQGHAMEVQNPQA